MSYRDERKAKVNIAHALMGKDWKIYGYKADESDSMTDYYSPAYWGCGSSVATKNGFVLVVDAYSNGDSGQDIVKWNYDESFHKDTEKLNKLRALRDDSGATEGEKKTAQIMIDKIESKEDKTEKVIVDTYPTFMSSREVGKTVKWHIEKDGAVVAKGNGIYKYGSLSWDYNCYEMQYNVRQVWNGEHDEDGFRVMVENTPDEENQKLIDQFEKFINKIDTIASVKTVVGDGTKETEKAGLQAEEDSKLVKVTKTRKKLVWKMIEVDRDAQIGDYITVAGHGHYWLVTNDTMRKGKWNGVEEERRALTYEIVGSAKRGYQRLKNPKRYYNWHNLMVKSMKVFELKQVEEVETYEVWEEKKALKKANKSSVKREKSAPAKSVNDDDLIITVERNEEKNGIEISFNGKPSEEIRQAMKDHGFRWSKYSKKWWAKFTDERFAFATSLSGGDSLEAEQQQEQQHDDITDQNPQHEYQSEEVEIVAHVKHNKDMNGLEIEFTEPLPSDKEERLKNHRFRYNLNGFYYTRYSKEVEENVTHLLNDMNIQVIRI